MDQMDIKAVNKAIVFSIIFVVIFILAIVGLTYAFFGMAISGNEIASSVTVRTVNLGTVTFNEGNQISTSNMFPGDQITKTFTIVGEDNEIDAEYAVYLYVDLNQFVQNYSNEFTYALNGSSSSGGTPTTGVSAEVPSARVAPYQIGTGTLKAGGDTHTYTFVLSFNEVGSNQDYNRLKNFSGRLSVEAKKYSNISSLWSD